VSVDHRSSYIFKPHRELLGYPVLVALAFISGIAHREIYGLQHLDVSDFIKTGFYLLSMPLAKLIILLPRILTGYFYSKLNVLLVFLVGCIAYIPYEFSASSGLNLHIMTILAHGAAYSVATTVSFMAGCHLNKLENPLTSLGKRREKTRAC